MTNASSIVHECGKFWVQRVSTRKRGKTTVVRYLVLETGATASTVVATYALSDADASAKMAIAECQRRACVELAKTVKFG